MSKPQILIIGCGAVGLSVGYFLSTGASITYLVRPGRKPAFLAPKNLYSYKDNALYVFSDYRVIESPSEVSGEEFYCVFDTLDGHTARSEGGVSTLKAVGDLVREKQNAASFVIYDAVGLDIEDHYATTMGIPNDRLLMAASMLAHQPTPSISIPTSADKDLVAKADLLYSYQPGNVGLIVINTRPALVKKLKEVYEQNGRLKIQLVPTFAQPLLMVAMLHLVTWNIDGWKEFDHLHQNKELWSLMLKAQQEIFRLPRLGWKGWLFSWLFGSWMTAKLNKVPEKGALPLSYHEFNSFHHGGKVVKQDIKMLEDLLAEGEKSGHKMVALREVCRKAEEVEEAKAKARANGSDGTAKTGDEGVRNRKTNTT
jgi:hypothetical protein